MLKTEPRTEPKLPKEIKGCINRDTPCTVKAFLRREGYSVFKSPPLKAGNIKTKLKWQIKWQFKKYRGKLLGLFKFVTSGKNMIVVRLKFKICSRTPQGAFVTVLRVAAEREQSYNIL